MLYFKQCVFYRSIIISNDFQWDRNWALFIAFLRLFDQLVEFSVNENEIFSGYLFSESKRFNIYNLLHTLTDSFANRVRQRPSGVSWKSGVPGSCGGSKWRPGPSKDADWTGNRESEWERRQGSNTRTQGSWKRTFEVRSQAERRWTDF